MYRIPIDLDFAFCVGSVLNQIAIGKYDVQFLFDSGAKIAVQGSVAMLCNGAVEAEWSETNGWSSLAFQSLLSRPVENARVMSDSVIELNFAEGFVLQLRDSSDQFESIQIYITAQNLPIVII